MRILFEDHHLIAVAKPAAMLTQGPAGVPSLEAAVKEYIKTTYAKPAGVYLGIPHRLDRPVSGVVLFARNTKAAARVAKQFQEHLVQKTYWALVEGVPESADGEWRDWLRKVDAEARTQIVPEGTVDAKEAITAWRTIARFNDTALLELAPRTGRMHQLRVQAGSRGHPIVGDPLYGSTRLFGPSPEHPRDRLIALHAGRLSLEHPFRKTPMLLEAPLPATWPEEHRRAVAVPVCSGLINSQG
jgi:23S rRNA pseudouridine1911/1915/1917 synthase